MFILKQLKNKLSKKRLDYFFNEIDKGSVITIFILLVIGVISSASISPAIAKRINIPFYNIFIRHCAYVFLFIIMMIIFSNSKIIFNRSLTFKITSAFIAVLIGVIVFGNDIKGSKRWIKILGLSFQPSEMIKPFFIVTNAHLAVYLSSTKNKDVRNLNFIVSTILLCLIVLLMLLQPDFGSTILFIITWMVQMFTGNLKMIFFLMMLAVFCIVSITGYFILPHVKYRILSFLNQNQEMGYQVKKAIQATHSGGFWGKGIGNGTVKFQLPDVYTDYAFSAIFEEWGFLLCSIIIFLFLFIIIKNYLYIFHEKDQFKKYNVWNFNHVIHGDIY